MRLWVVRATFPDDDLCRVVVPSLPFFSRSLTLLPMLAPTMVEAFVALPDLSLHRFSTLMLAPAVILVKDGKRAVYSVFDSALWKEHGICLPLADWSRWPVVGSAKRVLHLSASPHLASKLREAGYDVEELKRDLKRFVEAGSSEVYGALFGGSVRSPSRAELLLAFAARIAARGGV